jgi:uncharacterized membrane protein
MKEYLLFGAILLTLDVPFITFVVGPLYKKIPAFANLNIKAVFGLIAYLIMICSWKLIQGDIVKASMVGFVIYGTYAFTLACILPGYTLPVGLLELLWGTVLFSVATYITNQLV